MTIKVYIELILKEFLCSENSAGLQWLLQNTLKRMQSTCLFVTEKSNDENVESRGTINYIWRYLNGYVVCHQMLYLSVNLTT